MESEFYGDGAHNGGVYNFGNLNPYVYTYQNPIKYIDPNGKQHISPYMIAKRGFKNMLNNVKNFGIGAYNTFDSVIHRDPMYSSAEDDIPPVDPASSIGEAHRIIRSGTGEERWQLAGSVASTLLLAKALKGGTVKNVELMGGESSSLKGYINYDINAKVGIADDVANFGKYFKPGSLKNIVVNNPQAVFLEEISDALSKGGQVTVRGTVNNKFFKSIYNGKANGMDNFEVVSRREGLPNQGYLKSDGTPIGGSNNINEIILKKK